MAPVRDVSNSANHWEPGTIIELVALMLAIPGAIAALVTLWVLRSRLCSSIRG
jgi:hypothetical protein